MKLLFLIDGAYNPTGATHTLARLLCGALAEGGHRVTVLESCYHTPVPAAEIAFPAGVRRLLFADGKEEKLHQFVDGQKAAGASRPAIALKMLAHPGLLTSAVTLLGLNNGPLQRRYVREIEALCQREAFDWVVAVSAPHYPTFALAAANIPCKKAAYWLDPYAGSPYYTGKKYLRRELRLYQKLDAFFITDLMAVQNKETALAAFEAKIVPLPFPNLIKHCPERTNSPQVAKSPQNNSDEIIKCVFVGSFYRAIRTPQHLLRLFAGLPEDITLTIAGGWEFGSDAGDFPAEAAALGSRLTLLGRLPLAEAYRQMCDADILVNLGNQNPNQVPSKLFDYLSTGLPVLNLCATKVCSSVPVLKRYPYALSVPEQAADAQTLGVVADFCRNMKDKRLPFEAVAALYPENTPAAVAQCFVEALERF